MEKLGLLRLPEAVHVCPGLYSMNYPLGFVYSVQTFLMILFFLSLQQQYTPLLRYYIIIIQTVLSQGQGQKWINIRKNMLKNHVRISSFFHSFP